MAAASVAIRAGIAGELHGSGLNLAWGNHSRVELSGAAVLIHGAFIIATAVYRQAFLTGAELAGAAAMPAPMFFPAVIACHAADIAVSILAIVAAA